MTNKELKQLRDLNREISYKRFEIPILENRIQRLKNEVEDAETEYERLKNYINSIDDCVIRQIMTLRHVDGLSWVKVALQIGGNNTADSVRIAHERFLNEN